MSRSTARSSASSPADTPAEGGPAPLDARIDELLSEIDEASRDVASMVKEEEKNEFQSIQYATSPVQPTIMPAGSGGSSVLRAAKEGQGPLIAQQAMIDPSLEESIDEVIKETQRALAPTKAEVSGDVAEIDEALAASAELRMEEEAAAPDRETAPVESIEATPVEGMEEPVEPDAAASPVVQVVVSAPPEPLEADAAEMPEVAIIATDHSIENTTARKSRLIEAISWPMATLPVSARDLIGWFALVTLFNALCVWVYLIL